MDEKQTSSRRSGYEPLSTSDADDFESPGSEDRELPAEASTRRSYRCLPRSIAWRIVLVGAAIVALFLVFAEFDTEDWNEVFKLSSIFKQKSDGKLIQLQTLPKHLLPGKPKKHSHKRRLVVVGDVHGCKDELVHLLDKISFNTKRDHLILAGDLIDKGPKSQGVLNLARELHASCVRGNHEDNVLRYRDELFLSDQPDHSEGTIIARGKKASKRLAAELSEKNVAYIRQCPLILSLRQIPGFDFKETVVVHAGLVPGVPLKGQNSSDVMHMRTISESHGVLQPSDDKDDGKPWFKVWEKEQKKLPSEERVLVVYGHDSKKGLQVRDYTIGLDSACVSGGRLSALVIDGEGKGSQAHKEIVSVKCKNYR